MKEIPLETQEWLKEKLNTNKPEELVPIKELFQIGTIFNDLYAGKVKIVGNRKEIELIFPSYYRFIVTEIQVEFLQFSSKCTTWFNVNRCILKENNQIFLQV